MVDGGGGSRGPLVARVGDAVTERPILFNGPMVRAVLDGRKTQTRRPYYARPTLPQAGDRLWVRETFAANVPGCEFQGGYSYRADHRDPKGDGPAHPIRWTPSIHMPRNASRITLDVEHVRVERLQDISEDDARAEGLECLTKDLSLYKYGIPDRDGLPGTDDDGWPWQDWDTDPRKAFRTLWTRIYGAESWDANPLVWVCAFKRVTP